MNKLVNFLLTFSLLIFAALSAQAQDAEMADTMRSNGKIYVVVAIVLVILLGLVAYLISVDRKVSNLEKRLPEKK
jgi:CcmD family protein